MRCGRRCGRRSMVWVYLTAMAFMSVSGGPFGLEEVLQKIPFYQTIGLVVFAAFAHMVPTMMMTYEMVMVYDKKEASGGTIGWVEQTMGKHLGLLNAVYNIIDTAVDNAVYPVIIKDNLGVEGPTVPIVVTLACAAMNWKGTETTGKITLVQTAVILLPFVVLMMTTPADENMFVNAKTYDKVNLGGYQEALMIVIWNFSGFDMCASYIHTLKATNKDIKTSFAVTAFMTVFFYIVSLCCGTYYLHDSVDWFDGSWATIGFMKFGDWGMTLVQIASIVSSLATLSVELCATSYLWMGLVNLKAVPKLFKNYKLNLAINTLITMALSTTQPFDVLVETSALLNVSTIVFESIAWIKTFGTGMWHGRLIVAVVLVATNICVSMCLSASCIAALVSATSLGVLWTVVAEAVNAHTQKKYTHTPGLC